MLEYIRGTIDTLSPTQAIIDVNGLGYDLNISVNTYSAIQGQKEVKLLLHEVIREDTHDLYAFADETERQIFRLLIGVNGVGPNTARVILSGMTVAQLQACIMAGDHSRLKTVKGIGLKTAQRIIVDLKDKIAQSELEALVLEQGGALPQSAAREEAQAALIMLGFNKPAVAKVLDKVFADNPSLTSEQAIKLSLPRL